MDELSIGSRTRVIEVVDGGTDEWFVEVEDLGLEPAGVEAIAGGEPAENAAVARAVLGGEAGGPREVALLNAGAAIYVGGHAVNLGDGVKQARESVDSGKAKQVLEKLVSRSAELSEAS